MKAVALRRGADAPTVVDVPRPEPGDGEALVRVLRVGVDGTDHEVVSGHHGGFPPGDDHLVLGHEAVGVVEDPNGTRLSAGDVVVPTVRRPPCGPDGAADGSDGAAVPNDYFARGEADMAPPEQCVERGIAGAHGFMAEYVTSPAEFLVPLPDRLASLGFLVEPISITEKALEIAYASRAAFEWEPESAIVLGNGSLGLLTLAMLDGVDRTYCLGRRDRPDPSIDVVERLGATYVDSRETPVDEVAATHEPMDLVYEATGYAKHAFESVAALAPNGVTALLGVPEPWAFEVDGGALHRDLVMHNKAVVGSVNSRREHFVRAIDTLAGFPGWFTDALVTGVYPFGSSDDDAAAAIERAFAGDQTTIKTAVEFGPI